MKRSEKMQLLANQYQVSVGTIRLMIEQNLIPGAYAIKHPRKNTFVFGEELTKRLEEEYAERM